MVKPTAAQSVFAMSHLVYVAVPAQYARGLGMLHDWVDVGYSFSEYQWHAFRKTTLLRTPPGGEVRPC